MKTRNASPRSRAPLAATIAASLSLASLSFGVAPWGTPQMQPGIAIVTCIAPDTDALGNPVPSSAAYTCGLLDLRNPTAPLYGTNGPAAPLWNPPMSHETSWTADNLGMLFGSEIDADGDGRTNYQEFLTGGDPNSGIDPLLTITRSGENVILSFLRPKGITEQTRLQSSSTLGAASWQTVTDWESFASYIDMTDYEQVNVTLPASSATFWRVIFE
jgi:hypothetical protein